MAGAKHRARTAAGLIMLLLVTGCPSLAARRATAVERAPQRSRADCVAIDRSFGRYSTLAAIAGVIALGSGIGGALTDDQPRAELAFGISALVAGLTAGTSGFLTTRRAQQYTAECTVSAPR